MIDKRYYKYLESVFKRRVKYYYNVSTNEIISSNCDIKDVVYFDTYHTVKNLRTICDRNGNILYEPYCDKAFISGLYGFCLLETNTDGLEIFNLFSPSGELIFSYDNIKSEILLFRPQLVKRDEKIVLIDYQERVFFETDIPKSEKVDELKITRANINDVLQKFAIPYDLEKKLKKETHLYKIYYNDTFLAITALVGYYENEETVCLICRKIFDEKKKILKYDKKGFEAKFNNQRCAIRDKNLTYYQENGMIEIKFTSIDYNNSIIIDDTLAALINEQKINIKVEDKKLFAVINCQKYQVISQYHSNRLLLQSEENLYGFLDEKGKLIIQPEFGYAEHFKYGTAKVSGGQIDLNGKFIITLSNIERIMCHFNSNLCRTLLYDGTFNEDYSYPGLSLSKDDYLFYLKVCLSMESVFKKDIYYYTDYKTKEIIKTTYQPVRQYLNFMIFYITKNIYWQEGYYLLVKDTNSYIWLAGKDAVLSFFDNYFIIDNNTYYVTDRIITLGNFLINEQKLIVDILLSEEEYLEKLTKRKDDTTLELKRQKEMEILLKIKEYQEKIDEYTAKKNNLIHQLKRLGGERLELPEDFFVYKNSVKIVNPLYAESLKDYDLLLADFTDVSISGLNFEGTNALINPLTIYNKDMSNGNYKDVTFKSYDFTQTDISNSEFNNEFILTYQRALKK